MNAYKIQAPTGVRFAGSMSEAREKRNELCSTLGWKKTEVEISDYVVETQKAPLLMLLNTVASLADGVTHPQHEG